ncbi:glycosyltransferase [Microbacterium pygmaeum]|uniref:4,4'-diaponeurosporenoate glycosyltransferase n=1 Tax=Microbacterium pygmaeum TaxID=370764 RepID=A0A1G7WCZ4_9MICO|nr:glycosyltransferase [Microbacterium pygmaeum]SDG69877.1 Glycosyl transferase family 2 [Microbacterium pygmaeum]
MSASAIAAVLVVVPVHDEDALLGACLTALQVAIARTAGRGIRCVVRIVLDDCTDESALVAARFPFPVLTVRARAVGVARAAGIEDGLRELADVAEPQIWIANTDADSEVPPQWIIAQVAAAEHGADAFLGTVRPDFADLSPGHRRQWLATHPAGQPTGNTHGANLGIRASVYRAAGEFDPIAEHEDALLVERCRMLGATVHASGVAEVQTSGRVDGRTPGGYAGFVREQAQLFGSA